MFVRCSSCVEHNCFSDFTKVAMYIDNIAGVFFPVDGAEDPVWRARRCVLKCG